MLRERVANAGGNRGAHSLEYVIAENGLTLISMRREHCRGRKNILDCQPIRAQHAAMKNPQSCSPRVLGPGVLALVLGGPRRRRRCGAARPGSPGVSELVVGGSQQEKA